MAKEDVEDLGSSGATRCQRTLQNVEMTWTDHGEIADEREQRCRPMRRPMASRAEDLSCSFLMAALCNLSLIHI